MFYRQKKGLTLIESLVGVAIFMMIAISVYEGYARVLALVGSSRLKVTATALANEQFEIMRNLPYQDVGLLSGIPSGKIDPEQDITRDGYQFTVKTTVRNIDDPFDGTLGGVPNDLAPADYKLAEVEISCLSCKNFDPLVFSTHVAPKNIEGASDNGALFIRVFDANGDPVSGADVHVENNQEIPAISIDDTTNNEGMLQIVDAPPGVEAYEISVSKPGYSQEQTYTSGAPGNPNPVKPHSTIAVQQVTQISFAIDKVSTLNVESVTETCSAVGSIDFSLSGSKLIGTAPDVLKYDQPHVTNGSGVKSIADLEWDSYNFDFTDTVYDVIGLIPLFPVSLGPNTSQDLKLIVKAKNPNSLLVTVKDAATQLPLSGATVTLEKTGYSRTETTGRGFLGQTDWSGGGGQENFTDATKYFDSDGNVDTANPAGEVKLLDVFGNYSASGEITSSSFDTGSSGNFYQITWEPQDQPVETGLDSIKFQIATNNDNATWSFKGPDGTLNSFYTLADQNINVAHNGDRYLRYKAFLSTASTTLTPNLSDIAFTFTSSCVPPGQVFFSGLTADDYTLTVSKAGYQDFVDAVSVGAGWQERQVILAP